MKEALSGYGSILIAVVYLVVLKQGIIDKDEMIHQAIIMLLFGAGAMALHAAPSYRQQYKQRAKHVEQMETKLEKEEDQVEDLERRLSLEKNKK